MDFCVCCGNYVPEGSMVCRECWEKYMGQDEEQETYEKSDGEPLTSPPTFSIINNWK